jgi:hypothetical protein
LSVIYVNSSTHCGNRRKQGQTSFGNSLDASPKENKKDQNNVKKRIKSLTSHTRININPAQKREQRSKYQKARQIIKHHIPALNIISSTKT